ncbi:hypothetical protein ACXPWS_15320 [Mycobacterium sp. BMJ-28]
MFTPAYRRERRRRFAGWLFVAAGTVMAVVHGVTHLGRLQIVGYQDLLIGYPMATLLVLAGFILVGMTRV